MYKPHNKYGDPAVRVGKEKSQTGFTSGETATGERQTLKSLWICCTCTHPHITNTSQNFRSEGIICSTQIFIR